MWIRYSDFLATANLPARTLGCTGCASAHLLLRGQDQLGKARQRFPPNRNRSSSLSSPPADLQHPKEETNPLCRRYLTCTFLFFPDFSWKMMYVHSREKPGGSSRGQSVAGAAGSLENPPIPECPPGLPARAEQAPGRKEAFPWINPLLNLHDYCFGCQTQP